MVNRANRELEITGSERALFSTTELIASDNEPCLFNNSTSVQVLADDIDYRSLILLTMLQESSDYKGQFYDSSNREACMES